MGYAAVRRTPTKIFWLYRTPTIRLYKIWFNWRFSPGELVGICHGASVMVGSRSGVATRLWIKCPNLFVWHWCSCVNHRFELSVCNVSRDVTKVNHFQRFMDSVYCLYSMSPKNQSQNKKISIDLNSELIKIGRIFDVRWISSSFRCASVVWRSFRSLHENFELASQDATRDFKEWQKLKDLKAKL